MRDEGGGFALLLFVDHACGDPYQKKKQSEEGLLEGSPEFEEAVDGSATGLLGESYRGRVLKG